MAESEGRLNIETRQDGDVVVVVVRGSAGMSEAETMRTELEKLAGSHAPLIVLDLSGMDFICSAGLAAIICAHLRSRHHRGKIKLVNPQPAVRELLETTQLTKLFPIYADLDQAVAV